MNKNADLELAPEWVRSLPPRRRREYLNERGLHRECCFAVQCDDLSIACDAVLLSSMSVKPEVLERHGTSKYTVREDKYREEVLAAAWDLIDKYRVRDSETVEEFHFRRGEVLIAGVYETWSPLDSEAYAVLGGRDQRLDEMAEITDRHLQELDELIEGTDHTSEEY